jgi:four helix bundle protein
MVESNKEKVASFEQLHVWQYSQEVAVAVYKLVKAFPVEEKYGLSDQLRRSSSSISANIAEGFGRYSAKDKSHFYTIANGSLLETKSHLYLAHKLRYLTDEQLEEINFTIIPTQKMLNAFIKSINA